LTWTPGSSSSLHTGDWFTPFRDVDRDGSHKDQDLAAGGIIALPDGPGVIVGGKDGIYYNVNRAAMGNETSRNSSILRSSPLLTTSPGTVTHHSLTT